MTQLTACFVQALGIDPAIVTESLAYQSIPQWDSVGHMALVAELEAKFDIMLDTDDIIGMSSVAKAAEIVAKHGADPQA
ncbi:MAG: acyl carrier protein [Bryobacterales bacterium]|nr:acyl carrier protein [Bryobacterales bacterium]